MSPRGSKAGRFRCAVAIGAVALAVSGHPAGASAGPIPGSPNVAIWVWSWDDPAGLADYVTTEGFGRAYLYCQGGFTRKVRRTIAVLTRRGVRVEALGGERNWATGGRAGMIQFIGAARRYQARVPAAARLSGIHLDVEPWALTAWDRHPARTRRSFLDALHEARQAAGPLPVAADIPFWFDGIRLRHRDRTLSAAVMRRTDAVTVMAYRDRAVDVINVVRRELRQAGRLRKPLTVGVETGPVSPDRVTFFEEGRQALDRALVRIDSVLGDDPSFAGVAVHSYRSLMELE